jgi:hypothetical protein
MPNKIFKKSSAKKATRAMCNAHYWSDIFRLVNLSVRQIPVFRYDLLMSNWGYIEFETLKNSVGHI